jgi:uncharacterized protein YxjI
MTMMPSRRGRGLRLMLKTLVVSVLPFVVSGWTQQAGSQREMSVSSSSRLHMNFLNDIGDMMSGGKLVAQDKLPYGEPLSSVQSELRTFAIQERGISFTGEDFDVADLDQGGQQYAKVRGAMMHLPGKDKMRIEVGGTVAAVLDRKLVAMSPTYDIYRGSGGDKIGWIEKAVVALGDTFHIYIHEEGEFRFGLLQTPPAYVIEGDFLDRKFVVKNREGQAVAKVSKDSWIQFDAFNHYQVQVAPGMDAALVLACTCAVDEEFDEEHKEKAKREQ